MSCKEEIDKRVFKKRELKKEFDEQLIRRFVETKEERGSALALEKLGATMKCLAVSTRRLLKANVFS
ncbi:hypothetical protein QWY16_00130 [Planococcus shenhongbingii]|uniref:hypothetical protein n=1 Tax=Planococcus shenhongbingii TaxID=3058398 RepID=UPI0026268FFF|nr:hypothetical protein [Planococcus sp. N016]WKA58631.1 hypothetical protein QWY16_00130 [Planococcus sp. N016]